MIGPKRACLVLLGAVVSVAVAGCGGSGEKLVTVSGKVVQDGNPIAIQNYMQDYECLKVEFVPIDESGKLRSTGKVYTQACKEDGTFEMKGDMGDGIPVGRYRVAVYRIGEAEGGTPGDIWNEKFGPETSPWQFDIQGGEDLEIDVAKPPAG